MKTRAKESDCVEVMHRGALRIHEETKGMTVEEEVAYWRTRTKEARRWLAAGSAAEPAHGSTGR